MTEHADTDLADGEVFVASFACESCGLQKSARVHLPARSGGDSTLESAREVVDVLSRVACPRCEHVERPFRPIRAARLVLLGVAIALGSCVEAVTESSVFWWAGCVVGLGLAVRTFWKALGEAHLVRASKVQFTDEPVPVRQLAGKTCGVCSKRIVMDQDGSSCAACGATVHKARCADSHATTHGPSEDRGPYRGA